MRGCNFYGNLKSLMTLVSLLLWAPCTYAAGFDCKNTAALNQTEKSICANPELSKLDEKLNAEFQQRLKKTAYKLQLLQEQKNWVLQRNYAHSSCIDISEPEIDGQQHCPNQLKEIYQVRIDELNKNYAPQPCSSSKGAESKGVYSGDWIFEQFVQGKKWGQTLSINQQGNNLNGEWLAGGDGERVDSGTIQGVSNASSAFVKRCENFPNKHCRTYKAVVDNSKLSLFLCQDSTKCDKAPMFTLYQKTSKPCAAFSNN